MKLLNDCLVSNVGGARKSCQTGARVVPSCTATIHRIVGVNHYENFPVASRLCPAPIRPAVVAIYHFARTADDIADEGSAPAAQRLADLDRYRATLLRCSRKDHGADGSTDAAADAISWPEVFGPLAQAMRQHRLPLLPLTQLLDAFTEDARHAPYPNRAALLHYCERSANPVGRLMLHLYGIDDHKSLQQSDAVCTALQLINFWQDFSRDHPRGRCYLPLEDVERHGLEPDSMLTAPDSPSTQTMVRELVDWAEGLMLDGAPLALRVPGRAGWELRLVVAGGLRIVAKIRAMEHRCLHQRPRLRAWDLPAVLWQAARVRSRLQHHAEARPTTPPADGDAGANHPAA
jgi:hydroxysqualene synthase